MALLSVLGRATARGLVGLAVLAGCTQMRDPAATDATPALDGTRWRATAIDNGSRDLIPVLPEATVTLAFGADGRASGSGGCNRYTGTYTLGPTGLSFSQVASTRMACPGVEIMGQEQAYFRALGTVATARMANDRLELRRADGGVAVVLARDGG